MAWLMSDSILFARYINYTDVSFSTQYMCALYSEEEEPFLSQHQKPILQNPSMCTLTYLRSEIGFRCFEQS